MVKDIRSRHFHNLLQERILLKSEGWKMFYWGASGTTERASAGVRVKDFHTKKEG
jgi:hypothetical protein